MDNQIEDADDCLVQLLEHVPYVALCVRKDNACISCGQLKTKTRFSWRLTALNNSKLSSHQEIYEPTADYNVEMKRRSQIYQISAGSWFLQYVN